MFASLPATWIRFALIFAVDLGHRAGGEGAAKAAAANDVITPLLGDLRIWQELKRQEAGSPRSPWRRLSRLGLLG
jgi:hypothetical protein